MRATADAIDAGQRVYTRRTLAVYDVVVLGLSNRWIWRCPTARLAAHYEKHLSANHLDVGVGTGYFLDRCRFPAGKPRVALMDMNADALAYSAKRIARYQPETYRRNVLESIPFDGDAFDSIGVNYLLHCLPGTMSSKACALDHLIALANPGGTLFGSTLLPGGASRTTLSSRLMKLYNDKGIFSNVDDDLEGLERELSSRLSRVSVDVAGSVALFAGVV